MPIIQEPDSSVQAEKIGVKAPPGIPSKLVADYLNNCSKGLECLQAAIRQSDHGQARVLGHRLRGTGGAYGVPTVSQIGSLIEEASLRKDTVELRRQVAELEKYLSRIEIIAD